MGRGMLIIVSGLVIVSGIIQMSNTQRASVLPERSLLTASEIQARNSANSLLETAIEKIRNDNSWEGELYGGSQLPGNVSLKTYDVDNIGELDAKDDSLYSVGQGGWDPYKLILYAEAVYDCVRVVSEVLMTRDSFSKYSYFSDAEKTSAGTNIYFYSNDELSGPVHTNGIFKMSGDPTFFGHVSSPNMWRGYDGTIGGGANPDFQGTTDFAAKERPLPDDAKIQAVKNTAASEGLTFNQLSYLIMKDDGSIDAFEYNSSTGWSGVTNYPRAVHNGIVSSSEKIFLEGVVDGGITIHSEEEVELYGDIEYEVNPTTDPNSDDLLGVVSEGDIVIDRDAHSRSGSRDLTLHGSFMALGDSFRVENHVSGSFRGDLNLLGGIIQKTRGPVGTFSRYGLTGFSKKYDYDIRLGNSIPPHFPRESEFSIISWKERVAEVGK